jgi:hypothetical protein
MVKRELARGQYRATVTSASMAPLARPGDTFIVEPLGKRAPRFGDVVAAIAGPRAVMHRVVRKRFGFYITKGDGSPCADEPLRKKDILGRARALEKSDDRAIPLNTLRGRLVGAALASISSLEAILNDVASPPPATFRRFFYVASRLVCLALDA